MEKNQFEKILDTLKEVSIKTASSLRELLQTVEANAASPASGSLNARERIEAIFDKGTFMESGAYIRRRANELCADSDAFEGVICGWGSVTCPVRCPLRRQRPWLKRRRSWERPEASGATDRSRGICFSGRPFSGQTICPGV